MPEKTLVIVESPAKAKKIAGYLGPNYQVLASVGHIRDLAARKSDLPKEEQKKPWAKLAVNVDDGYQAFYVIHESKKATIAELKRALKDSDELLLATDEDREGKRSPGIYWKCYDPRFRSSAWFSMKSPRKQFKKQ